MYFWNVNALARDLKAKAVTTYEAVSYFIFSAIAADLVSTFAFFRLTTQEPMAPSLRYVELAENLALLGIFVWGVFYCYNINASGDNKDFLNRFVTLIFPTFIRFHVFLFLLAIPLGIIINLLYTGSATLTLPAHKLYDRATFAAVHSFTHLLMYSYLGRKFRFVAGSSKEL